VFVAPCFWHRDDDVGWDGGVGDGVEAEMRDERCRAAVCEREHGDAEACVVVLAEEERDAGFFLCCFGVVVEYEAVCEERVDLAPADEGDAAWAVGVAVKACEIEFGGLEFEPVFLAGRRDDVVFFDGWAPVDEVRWDVRVGWEGEVEVAFTSKRAVIAVS